MSAQSVPAQSISIQSGSAQWTAEQVLALAPDAGSAKNGRGLASARKWALLEKHEAAIWGECQGSGKAPYQTQIDLSEPAFRCSCPSRKFPCKHGLGLLLLLAEQPNSFAENTPPDWVADWLRSRTQRAEKQAVKVSQAEQMADPSAQAKRAAARQQKVSAGIEELRRWLEDRVRQGLAAAPQESYQVWETIAARMVDAQAPGLARQLRELAGIVHSGVGWHDRLLESLGQLYLITEGFARIEQLPAEMQTDLRTQIGWTINREEVLAGSAQSDLWLVVGQRTEVEDRLRIRRTWLLGLSTATFALLLDFAPGQQPFESSLVPGTCLEAELVFYPSAAPLRALIKTRQAAVHLPKPPPGATIAAALAAYRQAYAVCPWLEQFPLLLEAVVPIRAGDRWFVQEVQGYRLRLSQRLDSRQGWQLLALSGGLPFSLFGEWNGTALLPLSVWMEDRFYGFG